MVRRAFTVGFASCVFALAANTAHAHLIAANHATLNLTKTGLFAVVYVPVATLVGFDEDGDGRLSTRELDRHGEELRGEISRRFLITGEDRPTSIVRVDLVLSPEHEGEQDRAGHLVALLHVAVSEQTRGIGVWTDLFDPAEAHPHLTVTASYDKRAETRESVELRPDAPEHVFHLGRSPRSVERGALALAGAAMGSLLGLLWLVVRRRRARRAVSVTAT